MQRQFSYYFDGVRYTNTELTFLRSLVRGADDPQAVIDGIIESERRFNEDLTGTSSS